MSRYWCFSRSAQSFEQLARARKTTLAWMLTHEGAREFCQAWNNKRTARQVRRGTKAEFVQVQV